MLDVLHPRGELLHAAQAQAVQLDAVHARAAVDGDKAVVARGHGVVARAAAQRVGAATAKQHVVARIAGDEVGAGVARAADVAAAGEFQVFKGRAQHPADAGAHGVGARAQLFLQGVARAVDDVDVVTHAPAHDVGPGAAVQHVVAGVADEGIAQAVAGGVDVIRAQQDQRFDVGSQGGGDTGTDRVDAFVGAFHHLVAHVVHAVAVVAQAAGHEVHTRAAVQHVVAGVAGELVVQRVAGAGQVFKAGELQVFQVGAQHIGQRRADGVGAGVGAFRDGVARGVHHIGVVAQATGHGVVAASAVEHVVAAVAGEHVVVGVATAIDVGGAGELQAFDVFTQRETDAGLHEVGSGTCRFGDGVAHVVRHIGVVAQAAGHGVGAQAAVDQVVAVVAGELVVQQVAGGAQVAGAGEHQTFNVVGEHPADG